jgi:hypothetical protein
MINSYLTLDFTSRISVFISEKKAWIVPHRSYLQEIHPYVSHHLQEIIGIWIIVHLRLYDPTVYQTTVQSLHTVEPLPLFRRYHGERDRQKI